MNSSKQDLRVSDHHMKMINIILSSISAVLMFMLTLATLIPLLSPQLGLRFKKLLYNGQQPYQSFFFYLAAFLYNVLYALLFNVNNLHISLIGCARSAVVLHWLILSITIVISSMSLSIITRHYSILLISSGGNINTPKYAGGIAAVVSVGLAAIIAGVVYATNKDPYTGNNDFCWMSSDLTLWAVVCIVTPLFAFVIINLVIFVTIFWKFSRRMEELEEDAADRTSEWTQYLLLLFRGSILLWIDVVWILEYLTKDSSGGYGFYMGFSVLNGALGIYLFFLYFCVQYLNSKIEQKVQTTERTEVNYRYSQHRF